MITEQISGNIVMYTYISANNINEVVLSLEKVADNLFTWFNVNVMKNNAD